VCETRVHPLRFYNEKKRPNPYLTFSYEVEEAIKILLKSTFINDIGTRYGTQEVKTKKGFSFGSLYFTVSQ